MLERTHLLSRFLTLPSSSVPNERETRNWIPSLLRSSFSSSLPPSFPFSLSFSGFPAPPFLFQPQPQLHLPMSSAAVVSSGDNARRARSNTSIARPSNNVSLFHLKAPYTVPTRISLSPSMV